MALTKSFAIATGEAASDTTITTGTFNSTGFTHLVCLAKYEGSSATDDLTDNKSSGTFNKLTAANNAGAATNGRLHWVKIGSPGTGHTVTLTLSAARDFKGVAVWLVNASTSGNIELDAEASTTGSGPTMTVGTLSTTGVSVVSFTGIAENNSINWTNGSGWTPDFTGMSGVLATFGQSRGPETTSPITASASGDASIGWAGCAASFREAAGGGGSGLTVPRNINQLIAVNRAANF